MTPQQITALLRSHRYPLGSEAALQQAIEDALTGASVDFEREARLGPGERIDFLVTGGVGIEAKTRCGKRIIYRQLERYARHEAVNALILATGTAIGLPPALNGKPLFYVSLGRASL